MSRALSRFGAALAKPTEGHQDAVQNVALYAGVAAFGALAGYVLTGEKHAALVGAIVTTGWELSWFMRRVELRVRTYDKEQALARKLGKPLVVVGAPDRGCPQGDQRGDLVVDVAPSSCPNSVVADVTKPGAIPLPDDSAVVFAPYVLDYEPRLPTWRTRLDGRRRDRARREGEPPRRGLRHARALQVRDGGESTGAGAS